MKYLALLLLILLLPACGPKTSPTINYAYGPSIILVDGVYYNYFCASGSEGIDDVIVTTSTDGVNWSGLTIMLTSPGYDRCACDPSVVFFKGYYYMVYSGNIVDVQTANFVARSESPAGPFVKYSTEFGFDARSQMNPYPIILPKYPTADGSPDILYGAGQPSIVVVGDELYQWYTDTHFVPYFGGYAKIYFSKSSDGIHWSERIDTELYMGSIDVKFNQATGKFNMYGLEGNHTPWAAVIMYESDDGITWGPEIYVHKANDFANNIGVSGDRYGNLLEHPFVGYGAPRDYATTDVWAQWNMYRMDLETFATSLMVRTR